MAKKPESRLQKKIKLALEKEVGGFWFKVHGGPFQRAGLPDLIGCVCGLFFGLEVKVPRRGRVSDLQIYTIQLIQDNLGYACVVTSPEEAINFVRQALGETIRGRLLFGKKKSRCPVYGTANRQDRNNQKVYKFIRKKKAA